jgi:hypothetical protein
MKAEHIAFQGEVQLLNWSETHNGGAKVVLQLADSGDLEAFKLMTVRKGKVAGQRLAVVMVEIGEDEQPVPQHEPKARPGELCVMACTFCADPKFWAWLAHHFFLIVLNEATAKETVLNLCVVTSRKNLDTDTFAASRFHTLIRAPYLAWRNQQN